MRDVLSIISSLSSSASALRFFFLSTQSLRSSSGKQTCSEQMNRENNNTVILLISPGRAEILEKTVGPLHLLYKTENWFSAVWLLVSCKATIVINRFRFIVKTLGQIYYTIIRDLDTNKGFRLSLHVSEGRS